MVSTPLRPIASTTSSTHLASWRSLWSTGHTLGAAAVMIPHQCDLIAALRTSTRMMCSPTPHSVHSRAMLRTMSLSWLRLPLASRTASAFASRTLGSTIAFSPHCSFCFGSAGRRTCCKIFYSAPETLQESLPYLVPSPFSDLCSQK
jgi:hypothetical protein